MVITWNFCCTMHGSLCTIAQQEFDQFPSYKAPFCSGFPSHVLWHMKQHGWAVGLDSQWMMIGAQTKIKDGTPGKTSTNRSFENCENCSVLSNCWNIKNLKQEGPIPFYRWSSLPFTSYNLSYPLALNAPQLCGNISSALAPMVTSQPTALCPAKVADLEILAHRADEASPFRVWRAQRRKGPRTMAVCSWKKQRTSNYYKMVDCPTGPAWLQEVSQTSFRDVGSPAPII